VTSVHVVVAYVVLAGFGALALWALGGFLFNRAPGTWFWNLLGALQVTIGLQVVIGGILFFTGARPDTSSPTWLHYIYGAVFPALVLVLAHRFARRWSELPWAVFGVASFVCFFSLFRALQTGFGWA
jgi:multidrug transporter EmrE-like cation transporter